jgi:hypothetical protein
MLRAHDERSASSMHVHSDVAARAETLQSRPGRGNGMHHEGRLPERHAPFLCEFGRSVLQDG